MSRNGESSMREAVAAALQGAAVGMLREAGRKAWKFSLAGAARLEASANLVEDDSWLTLRTPLADGHIHGEATPACAWELVEFNAQIAGPARACILTGGDEVILAADICLNDPAKLPARVARACASIEQAYLTIVRRRAQPSIRPPFARSERSSVQLSDLVSAAGWPFVARRDGALAVTLETDGHYSALVRDDGTQVTASLELTLEAELGDPSRRAIGTMLLGAGGALRMARGGVTRRESGDLVAVLDVRLDDAPAAVEIDQALCALSLAARMCAQEISVLCDERIATTYLALWGRSPAAHGGNGDRIE